MEQLALLRLVAAVLCGFAMGRLGLGMARRDPNLKDVALDVQKELYNVPPGHGKVMVPSTQRDSRGEVHNLRIGGFRFNVLVSLPGTLRSGDVHRADQYDMLFDGQCSLTTREGARDVVREYGRGDLIVIPANTPHMFRFRNHTVMAEWWDLPGGEPFEARYYAPYRRVVDHGLLLGSASTRAAVAAASSIPGAAPSITARASGGGRGEPHLQHGRGRSTAPTGSTRQASSARAVR